MNKKKSLYKAEATSANLSHSSSMMPDVPRPADDPEDSDERFTPFNYTGYECAHMYMYWPDEQRKAWKTHTPFHPRYETVLSGWHIVIPL